MKIALIVTAILLIGSAVFFIQNETSIAPGQNIEDESSVSEEEQGEHEEGSEEGEEPDTSARAEGTVIDIDTTGAMLDGPILITIETTAGESRVIAVPSMGIRLCTAVDAIADPFAITVGTKVSVMGSVENDRIIPCTDESHYLKVEN